MCQNQLFFNPQMLKCAVFDILDVPKLISRKNLSCRKIIEFLHSAPKDLMMFEDFISVWLLSFTIINFWPMDGPKWSKTNLFHRYIFFFKSNNFTEVFQRRTLQCESISWRLFSIYRSQIWRKNMSMWSFSAQSMFQVVKHGKRKSL